MKVQISRQPIGLVFVTFAAMIAAAVARTLNHPYPAETMPLDSMPLAGLIDSLIAGVAGKYIAGILILIVNAILLTRIMIIYKATFTTSYLPFVMYAAAALGVFYPTGSLVIPLLALMLVVSSEQAVSSFRRKYRFGSVFNSAFALGFIPMLYAPAICLFPILVFTLIVYHRSGREAIVAMVAFLLPLLFCTVGWWAAGYPWSYIVEAFTDGLLTIPEHRVPLLGSTSYPSLALAAIYVLLILASVIFIWGRYTRYPNRVRKIYVHFILLIACTGGMFFIPSANPVVAVSLTAVPATILGTHFFVHIRGWIALTAYMLLIAVFFAANLEFLFI